MSDDRMWREWSQSAKQAVREKYPFQLEKLEQDVFAKIKREKRRRRWQVTSWAAGVAVAALFFFQIVQPFNEGEALWGLTGAEKGQEAFEWITPDEGFMHALKNGYPILPEVKLEKDGYVFQIRDTMVDHRRITFTLLISGEKMEEIARIPDESKRNELIYGGLRVDLGDLREIGGASRDFQQIDGVQYLIYRANYRINEKVMRTILNQPKPVLPLQIVDAHKNGEEKVVAELLLPLPKSVTVAEKVIEPAAGADTALETADSVTSLQVNKMIASPTVTEVELEANFKEGYELHRLENMKLVDGSGKEYQPIDDKLNANVKQVMGTNTYKAQFIPSLFFEELPEKLELRFDKVTMRRSLEDTFVLDLNAKYPQSIPFGKKKQLHIEKAYYEKGRLVIVIPNKGPEEISLRVDGKNYRNLTPTDDMKSVLIDFEVPKKETYEVKMSGLEWERVTVDGVIPLTK
ncbi:hypothetical protein [Brevibacillus sp. 179-C9.3 HS]|uniref:hypothetical protein n=1 Tax=unclassified Brevibacillus TaxID=2684853 RepID=UPI0039A02137